VRVRHELPAALARVELAADDVTVGEGVVELWFVAFCPEYQGDPDGKGQDEADSHHG
jgi:hypothetical protein